MFQEQSESASRQAAVQVLDGKTEWSREKENGINSGVSNSNTALLVPIISHSHTNKNSHEES